MLHSSGEGRGAAPTPDAELELSEWVGLLIRLAFWRANPHFGLHGVADEVKMPHSQLIHSSFTPHSQRIHSAFRAHAQPVHSSVHR